MSRVPEIITLVREAATSLAYENHPVASVNDHVVRISIMTGPFRWHHHPNSDETFLVLEGVLLVDLEDTTLRLGAGQMVTIPKGMRHNTRPDGARSVNITIEAGDMRTTYIDGDG
jgi:mannose-6-phosphate isomerase-like protein (cupin superfamily)